jgi:hypothetical protein
MGVGATKLISPTGWASNKAQMVGREELFERERHQEPVAGWHACVLASADLEEVPN